VYGNNARIGQTIRFTYISSDGPEKFKRVLVLNPSWKSKLHGLDLNRMTPAECEVIRAIFDPKTKEEQHRFPLVNDILRRMDPVAEAVENPFSFYRRFCQPFLRTAGDVYRTYLEKKITNVVIETETTAKMPVNQKPLFKPLGSEPLGTKPLGEGAPLGIGAPLGGKPLGGSLFKK
jgi:hypothetical protein